MDAPGGFRWLVGRIVHATKTLAIQLRLAKPPAMIGAPPSARKLRAIPGDPAEHAADFAARYAVEMDHYVSQRMIDLRIPTGQIGSSDVDRGIRHAAFMPYEREGGGNGPGGRLTVDSGVFNPDLFDALGPVVSSFWKRSRLPDRVDAIIAHEHAEAKGMDHMEAVNRAPDTDLPIREGARRLLRVIAGRERLSGRE
jgi:hypothetical protein